MVRLTMILLTLQAQVILPMLDLVGAGVAAAVGAGVPVGAGVAVGAGALPVEQASCGANNSLRLQMLSPRGLSHRLQ